MNMATPSTAQKLVWVVHLGRTWPRFQEQLVRRLMIDVAIALVLAGEETGLAQSLNIDAGGDPDIGKPPHQRAVIIVAIAEIEHVKTGRAGCPGAGAAFELGQHLGRSGVVVDEDLLPQVIQFFELHAELSPASKLWSVWIM